MRLGLDATALLSPLTGIGRYTLEVVRLLNVRHKCRLYAPLPLSHGLTDFQADVRIGNIPIPGGRLLWTQTYLPYQIYQDQLDVFWGPNHRLPLWLPKSVARVVTIHDLVWKYAAQTMRFEGLLLEKLLMPKAVQMADLIMVDSHSTANDLLRTLPSSEEKIRVVHLGASQFGEVNAEFELKELGLKQPYFLFVGTFEPRKNLARLLEAYSQLPQATRQETAMVLVGQNGWGGVHIPELVKQFGIEDQVKVFGYVSDQQLSALYQKARALCLPSLHEGFGLPIVEAFQYGTPVLTSNTSSMLEVAGEAALLVDPLSTHAIHDGLLELCNNQAVYEMLSQRAKDCAKVFTWQKTADEVGLILQEAIGLRKQRK
jgi:glycosyltransferase involved in cell wall biosynthesis